MGLFFVDLNLGTLLRPNPMFCPFWYLHIAYGFDWLDSNADDSEKILIRRALPDEDQSYWDYWSNFSAIYNVIEYAIFGVLSWRYRHGWQVRTVGQPGFKKIKNWPSRIIHLSDLPRRQLDNNFLLSNIDDEQSVVFELPPKAKISYGVDETNQFRKILINTRYVKVKVKIDTLSMSSTAETLKNDIFKGEAVNPITVNVPIVASYRVSRWFFFSRKKQGYIDWANDLIDTLVQNISCEVALKAM